MKSLEFPLSSFIQHSNPVISSEPPIEKMTRSADYITFDSTATKYDASCYGKVHLNVEEGDDYNSDDDICGSSPSVNSGASLPCTPWHQTDPISVNGKRPADDYQTQGNFPDEAKRPRLSLVRPTKALTLPESIWTEIFSQLPPQKLAQLQRTCRLFQKYLLNESIWRASRKQWIPEMPKPVFNLKEWEMLALAKGDGCMICGNKTYTRAIYWAFRVRCCTQCFNQNMTKESSLSERDFPMGLLTALPFGFIDASGQWVHNALSQRSTEGLTKVYWNKDLKSIRERYEEAKAMNAEEEWLKGLETEGIGNKVDVIRMESFESRWFSRGKGRPSANGTKPHAQNGHPLTVNNHGSKGNSARPHWQYPFNTTITHSHPQPQAHQYAHSMVHHPVTPHLNTHSPMVFPAPNGQLTPGGPWQAGHHTGSPTPTSHHGHSRTTSLRNERSILEVAEVRARRQQDIEARCFRLDPPIPLNVLQHMPAFKTTMLIAVPFTDQAWENLLPKLLEQRAKAEETERGKLDGQVKLQKQMDEKKAYDLLQRELKEKKEKEWEEAQLPVKEKLDRYATDIINLWLAKHPAGQHPSVNKESSLRFAPEVLVQIRKKFYDENPYTLQDPNHHIMLDPSTPQGVVTLETPTGKRLLLENMKYVFDTKIKPITDHARKELFLCSGCENNPKLYGFEGVIQHYAAKHTNSMSLGSVVVHWKADWPYCPPFILDPSATPHMGKHIMQAPHKYQIHSHLNSNMQFGAYNTTHRMLGTQMEIPPQTMIANGYPNGDGTYINRVYTGFSAPQQQYNFHAHGGSMTQTINISGPLNEMTRLQQTTFAPYQLQSETQRAQFEEIAATARESWFQLNGIKDLPSSVRVYYVIQKVVKAFQVKFSPLVPQLNMFIEALRDHTLMKPMRNVNGLQCLACTVTLPHTTNPNCGANPVGRVFTLISLVQHFEMVHVVRSKSPIKLDWKTQMIRLPEQRAIGMLRDAMGMDEQKLRLLKEVFPVAFNLPLPMPRCAGGFVPSPGPFPIPSHSVSPNSPHSTDSASPRRDGSTKETSPSSEQSSPSPKSSEAHLLQTEKTIMVKHEISVGNQPAMRSPVVTKKEPCAQSPEYISESNPVSMTAAEKFLATFLQDNEEMADLDDPTRVSLGEEDKEPESISTRSQSPPSYIKREIKDSDSHPVDQHYREKSPIKEEKMKTPRDLPISPVQSQSLHYEEVVGYTPPSPKSRSPRGRGDVSFSDERGRSRRARDYFPHSRSRIPRLPYLAPRPAEDFHNHDHRIDMYPRDPLREYFADMYSYRERNRSSAGSLARQSTTSLDARYYDTLYGDETLCEDGRYLDEAIAATRRAKERSRSPPNLRHQSISREYRYSYPPHHDPPYYTYPAPAVLPAYPYLDANYARERETHSRSPLYGIDSKRSSSSGSRYSTIPTHSHPPQTPLIPIRDQEIYEDYLDDRRARDREIMNRSKIYTHHSTSSKLLPLLHSVGGYDEFSGRVDDRKY